MSWHSTSRHLRGYGKSWDRIRELVLQRDCGLCKCDQCKAANRLTIAREVDHIVSKADAKRKGWTQAQTDDMSNLRAVAHDCHVRITLEQQGKTYKPKAKFDSNGRVVW